MLSLARSIRPKPASGEGFCRNQGTTYVDGADTEGGLIRGDLRPVVQFTHDKFLEQTVDVYLDEHEVSSSSTESPTRAVDVRNTPMLIRREVHTIRSVRL